MRLHEIPEDIFAHQRLIHSLRDVLTPKAVSGLPLHIEVNSIGIPGRPTSKVEVRIVLPRDAKPVKLKLLEKMGRRFIRGVNKAHNPVPGLAPGVAAEHFITEVGPRHRAYEFFAVDLAGNRLVDHRPLAVWFESMLKEALPHLQNQIISQSLSLEHYRPESV